MEMDGGPTEALLLLLSSGDFPPESQPRVEGLCTSAGAQLAHVTVATWNDLKQFDTI